MRSWFVTIIWFSFLARGCFYCSFLPLWEGYDEWAHFGFIERIVSRGELLVDRAEPVSKEVQTSMELAPAPWGTAKPSIPGDVFWALSTSERSARLLKLRQIPASWSHQPDPVGAPIYEALQPPLYYWISACVYRLALNNPLLERVFLLRYLGVLICSISLPIIFLLARKVTGSSSSGLLVMTLVSLMPELMIDICRVGNECLGILLFSWLTLLCVTSNELAPPPREIALWTGIALGLGLITKAYFLTAIPALGVVYLWRIKFSGEPRAWALHSTQVFGVAFLLSGWWYIRNRLLTGTWSGLLESVKVVHYSLAQFWAGAAQVHWGAAIDSIMLSHIWFGGWSSLHTRSWIYHLLFVIAGAGVTGVVIKMISSGASRKFIAPLLSLYAFFWLGQLYNVLLLFLTKGASTSMGWYMYCVVAVEATLLVVGIQALFPAVQSRLWPSSLVIVLVGSLDFYTVNFISIPYYVGLTPHTGNSNSFPAFRLSQLHEIGMQGVLERLALIKPVWLTPQSLGILWMIYVIATLTLIILAVWLALRGPLTEPLTEQRARRLRAW